MGSACATDKPKGPSTYFHTNLDELLKFEKEFKDFAKSGYAPNVPVLVQDALALPIRKGPPKPEGWIEQIEMQINEKVTESAHPERPLLRLLKTENMSASGVAVLLHHFFDCLPEPLVPETFNDHLRLLRDKPYAMQNGGRQTIVNDLKTRHPMRHPTVEFVLKALEKHKDNFSDQEKVHIVSGWFKSARVPPGALAGIMICHLLEREEEEPPAPQQSRSAPAAATAAAPQPSGGEEEPVQPQKDISNEEKYAKYGTSGPVMPGQAAAPKQPEPQPQKDISNEEKYAKYGTSGPVVPGAAPAATAKPTTGAAAATGSSGGEEEPVQPQKDISNEEKYAKYGTAGPVVPGSEAKPKQAAAPAAEEATALEAQQEEEPAQQPKPQEMSNADKYAMYGSSGPVIPGQSAAKTAPAPESAAAEEQPQTQVDPTPEEKYAKYGTAGPVVPGASAAPQAVAAQPEVKSGTATPHQVPTPDEVPVDPESHATASQMPTGRGSMHGGEEESTDEEGTYDTTTQQEGTTTGLPTGVHPSADVSYVQPDTARSHVSDTPAVAAAGQQQVPQLELQQAQQQQQQPQQVVPQLSEHAKDFEFDPDDHQLEPHSGYQTDVSHGDGGTTSGWESGPSPLQLQQQQRQQNMLAQQTLASTAAPAATANTSIPDATAAPQPVQNEQQQAPAPTQGSPQFEGARDRMSTASKELMRAKLAFVSAIEANMTPPSVEAQSQQQPAGRSVQEAQQQQQQPVQVPISNANRGDVDLCMTLVQHMHRDMGQLRNEVGRFVGETATLVTELQNEMQSLKSRNEKLERQVQGAAATQEFRDKMQMALKETTNTMIELTEDVARVRSRQIEADAAMQSVREDNDRLAADVVTARVASSEITMKWCDIERQLLAHEQQLSGHHRQMMGLGRDVNGVATNLRANQSETTALQRRMDVHRDVMVQRM